MALRSPRSSALAVLLACLALSGSFADAAAGKKTKSSKSKGGSSESKATERVEGEDAHYIKEDLPYIQCGTCVAMVEQAVGLSREMKADGLGEADFISHVEELCDVRSGGKWMTWMDMQEDGDFIKLVNLKQGLGACGSECRTIAKACSNVLEDIDITEFSEKVWSSNMLIHNLAVSVCKEMSNFCAVPDRPVKRGRIPGPAWKPAPPENATKTKKESKVEL